MIILNKEIKIINYVFKFKGKLNLISLEHYHNYFGECDKIKLIIFDRYIEKNVKNLTITENKLVFDDLVITKNNLEFFIEDYHFNLNVDNSELLLDFQKANKGSNTYKMFDVHKYDGKINEEEVNDKIYVDLESITEILDDYYKVYSIDFLEFSGSFTMVAYDRKCPNIKLIYKDTEYKNKKIANVRDVKFFKLSTIKLIINANYYWKVNLKVQKVFKSNPAIIPFKYHKGQLMLKMKKNLFKTNLDAVCKEMLVISYKYI